jgi:hypothetical protein
MGHPWFVIDVLFRHKWTKKGHRVYILPRKKEKQKLPQSCSKGRIFFRIRQGLYRTMGSISFKKAELELAMTKLIQKCKK